MTDAQKIMLGIKIEPDIAARAEKRMLAGRKVDPEDMCPQGRWPQTRDEVARTVQLGSGRTYERGRPRHDA